MSRFSKKLKKQFDKSMDKYLEDNSFNLKSELKNKLYIIDNSSKSKKAFTMKIIFVGFAMTLILLVGLFAPRIINYNKNIPTYQNMEVVKDAKLQNTSVKVSAISREISYYAKINEKIIIKININNPQSYEILSLRLNDKLYQSYQFLYGSNSEEIYVEFEVQENPGIGSITIDQIKYVQETTIKNAKYVGDRTIDIAIEYPQIPMVENFEVETDYNAVVFKFNIKDFYNIGENYYFYLFDGKNLVKTSVDIGFNEITFDLEYQKEYQYQIVSMFDSLNGEGRKSYSIYEGLLEVNSPITIEQLKQSKESLNFVINAPLNIIIEEVNIYYNDQPLDCIITIDDDNYIFNNLSSNTLYKIVIEYSYQLKDKVYKNQYTFNVSTLNKEMPSVTFTSLVCFNNIIYGYYELKDNDKVGRLSQINLYKDGILIQEFKDIEYSMDEENELVISIEENGNYSIGILYEYDMNDGNGIQVLEEKIIVDR